MTTPTEWRQKRNELARKTGGTLNCPTCGHVLDWTDNMYHCEPCAYYWDTDGQIIKETPCAYSPLQGPSQSASSA